MAIDSRPKNLFEKFLSINVMLLKAGGSLNERNSLQNPVGLITLAFLAVWSLAEWHQVVFHISINREITIRSICSIFSGYLATTKGLSLIFYSKNLQEILQSLSVMWEEQYKVARNRNVMLTMAKKAYGMTSFYCFSCALISLVFHLSPYKDILIQYFFTKNENNTYNLTTILPAKYPMDINYVGNYVPVIIVEHAITMFFLVYLTSSDTLFCQMLTHLCLHFKLIQNDLENIIEKVTVTRISNEENCKALKKLSKIIKRQNELYLLCRQVEAAFRSILFVSMLVASITICLSLHQIQEMIAVGQVWEGIGEMSHGTVLLSEVAIYCGFSSMLSHETECVAIAAYNCPWPCMGKQFCSQLQFLMLRAQKTFRCRAYGFFRLDLPRLTTIVSTVMTYFTLVNTLVKKK